jgi:hypothetical protein
MRILLSIAIFFSLMSCSQTEPFIQRSVYYIYDKDHYFARGPIRSTFTYEKVIMAPGAFNEKIPRVMVLIHEKKDTIFKKPNSFLKNGQYFNSKWLEVNAGHLFELFDTVRIYMIEKIENTDSIAFYRVKKFVVYNE